MARSLRASQGPGMCQDGTAPPQPDEVPGQPAGLGAKNRGAGVHVHDESHVDDPGPSSHILRYPPGADAIDRHLDEVRQAQMART
jgi:hypothetical protein